MKAHHIKDLKAYYTKKGRLWNVETTGEHHQFRSVEAMVEAFPDLLDIEPIKATVDRRAASKPIAKINRDKNEDSSVLSKIVQCYYCSGKGEVVPGIPCSNCNGKGKITVTTKAF